MKIGTHVRIKTNATKHVGRTGIVVEFNPGLGWNTPRALLAPGQCVCVHLFPKTKLEERRGSPITMMYPEELVELPERKPQTSAMRD